MLSDLTSDDGRYARREFSNAYGERFTLLYDREEKTGWLAGDEFDRGDGVVIMGGELQGDFLLSAEEHNCLADQWQELTGQPLKALTAEQALAEHLKDASLR